MAGYFGLFFAGDLAVIALLFIFCGIYQGSFRPLGRALAADFVPEHLRTTGLGWFRATGGFAQLAASLVAGVMWDHVDHTRVFLYGAAGMVALILLIPRKAARTDPG